MIFFIGLPADHWATCFVAHALPIDATSETRHEIAHALVGLGLFVPGAAIRPPEARRC